MKILTLLCIVLFSCNVERTVKEQKKEYQNQALNNITISIIDSCEYITFPSTYGYYGFTHKGNCKNCIK